MKRPAAALSECAAPVAKFDEAGKCILPRRPLGSTGLDVSVLGVGGGPVGIEAWTSQAEALEAVQTWLAHSNVNFIDTSPSYGKSEERLGVVLTDVPRASFLLQSKCGDEGAQNGGHSPFSRAGVLSSVQQSLTNLKTSYLDSLLLHDPYADELDAFLGPGGGVEAMRELKSAGVIKHFGLGCREHEPHLRLLRALGPEEFQISITVDDHNLMRRFLDQQNLKVNLREANVGLINAAPLYRGLLTERGGIYSSGMAEAYPGLVALADEMRAWASARDASLLDLAVQFPFKDLDIPMSIYGCSNADQVKGVLKAATNPLVGGLWDAFEEAFHDKILTLPPEKHFYWFKKQKKGNVEWPEMTLYPRAIWQNAFVENRPSPL